MTKDNKKITRVMLLIIYDLIAYAASFFLANIIVNNGQYNIEITIYLYMFVFTKVIVSFILGLYNTLWKYASVEELLQIVVTSLASNIIAFGLLSLLKFSIPLNVIIVVFILDLLLIGGVRIFYRTARVIKNMGNNLSSRTRLLIVGAGDVGVALMKDVKNRSNYKYQAVGFVDDEPAKIGKSINGTRILGTTYNIKDIIKSHNVDEVIIAIANISEKRKREIIKECSRLKCKVMTLPPLEEIINCDISINQVRDVEIGDLLGRDEVELNNENICNYICNKRVLVTGGGGSIGSELCRQIIQFKPKHLIILDIYENNAYEIENELRKKYPNESIQVIITTVRDKEGIEEVFIDTKPQVVFHAAAHKHVPLMENNPKDAVKNNVFGTHNVAQAADKYGVEKFVLISTDKAVNPTNIMGATKRLCEMVVQSLDKESKTDFVAVRFGNVLGSNGSVIPLFKKQIANGGPITVTHPNIIRYFMSIKEAAQLVIQAGGIARGGEIFVLDMGEPVKIVDLARELIRLSGLEPEKDIPIKFVGLRPGEKLYEELLLDDEGIETTIHEKIFIGRPSQIEYSQVLKHLNSLKWALQKDRENIKEILQKIVPTYINPEVVNEKVSNNLDEEGTSEVALGIDLVNI